MTAAEPSQRRVSQPGRHRYPARMFTILLGEDECGSIPLLLRDGEAVLGRPGYRWRVVATTDDPGEAEAVMELLIATASANRPPALRDLATDDDERTNCCL